MMVGLKKVGEDDDEGGEGVIDIHGGQVEGCPPEDVVEGGGRGRRWRNRE